MISFYQQNALDGLRNYLLALKSYPADKAAQLAFWTIANRQYHHIKELGATPFVCIKIPTGGGKTIVAAHAVGGVFKEYLRERNDKGLVLWLVPSDAIKKQTLDGFRNRRHPYRAVLDEQFGNAIKVFDLTEAKAIKIRHVRRRTRERDIRPYCMMSWRTAADRLLTNCPL